MKRVAFYTLGCKLNYAETSSLSRILQDKGYQQVDFTDTPDIYVINTCSVTDNADRKCRKVVREARKVSPSAYVAIVGCYAQLKPAEIANIPGVDAVLGAAEKFRIVELLDGFTREEDTVVHHSPVSEANDFHTSWSAGDRTRSFLKVQDGCDYTCSFCTIPMARGESRSDTIDHIVTQAEKIASEGIREIVLTGVNIGDFGLQRNVRKERLIDLIKALETVKDIERFRISSIEPNLLTDEIIDRVASSEKFVPHFHIPLQSGSDKVLKLMRRRYLRQVYANRVNRIMELLPNACIGSDVIVGFPGESHDDFLETYQFINGLPVSYLHVFSYSERPNTPALQMEEKVPASEKAVRSKMLRVLSEKKKRAFYTSNLHREAEVLLENVEGNNMLFGHTDNYVKVGIPYDPMLVGEIIPVRLRSIEGDAVIGDMLSKQVVH